MASKYDITGALTPVTSTFVDPGLETFKEAAQMYRASYDKNKDAYNLTKRVVNQMQLMPGDEDAGLRDRFSSNIDSSFEQIIASGAYEDADMAVQNAVEFITSDKTVLRAQQNAAEYLKEEALIEQFGPSGVLDFNKNARETFTTESLDQDGNVVLNRYRENMEQKEGYAAFMNDLVSGIAESGSPWISDKYGVTGEQVGQFLTYGNTVGVSNSKMERVVNELYETYVQDKVGDQDFRRLTQINDLSASEAKQDIINRMKAIARKQVGMKTTLSGLSDLNKGNQNNNDSPLQIDKYTEAILTKGPQKIDITTYREMTGGVDGSAPNSVMVSGQQGILIDFASQMPNSTRNQIASALVDGNIAADLQEASSMVAPLLSYLVAEEAGDTDMSSKLATSLGFDYSNSQSKDMLNTISQRLKAVIDTETLNNMGHLITAQNVGGSFVVNSGDQYNAEVIGGDIYVDGRYWFTQQEMENLADQMGIDDGTGGWFFGVDIFGDNLENIKDASGNPIFQSEGEIDGVTYWSMAGKSVTPFNHTAGDKWNLETMGQDTQDDNQVNFRGARDMAYEMDQTQVSTVSNIVSDLSGVNISQSLRNEVKDLGQAYLQLIMQNMSHGGSPTGVQGQNAVQNYSQVALGLRKVISVEANKPGATRESVQNALNVYYMMLFPPAE
tara:strand:- start:5727 stop:7736 length:2010 start_codon:yes stop_codon:yes gene_type:complete